VPFTATVATTEAGGGAADAQTLVSTPTTPNAYGITLNNLANNGTVVLTAAGAVDVNIKDAGTAGHDTDVLNIITEGTASVGYLQADDVETINISASETYTLVAGELVANGDKQTLVLGADTATKVVVGGEGALDLTLYNSALVETVDAGTNKGGLTFTASLADLVVKGGTGADDLTANANGVKLYGNDGADTFTVNMGFDSVRLFGGAGNDTFEIKGGSTTNSTYTVIDGVNAGDVISLFSGAAGTTAATSFKATKVELSEGATVTTQALIEKALGDLSANEIGWFTNGNFTFLVLDGAGSASTTYQANDDVVVMLTGVVDLSTASFNTSNLLEIA